MKEKHKELLFGFLIFITLIAVLVAFYFGVVGGNALVCLILICIIAGYASVLEERGSDSGIIGLLESLCIFFSFYYMYLIISQFNQLIVS